MRNRTKATNITLTDAISQYLDKKLSQVEKFISDRENAMVDVELGKTTAHHKNGDVFRAEIMISDGGNQYRAEAETSDLYASIDKAKDDIIRELKTSNAKERRLLRRGALRLKNILRGIPWPGRGNR